MSSKKYDANIGTTRHARTIHLVFLLFSKIIFHFPTPAAAGGWHVISKERERLRNLHKRVSQIPTPASQALDDNKPSFTAMPDDNKPRLPQAPDDNKPSFTAMPDDNKPRLPQAPDDNAIRFWSGNVPRQLQTAHAFPHPQALFRYRPQP